MNLPLQAVNSISTGSIFSRAMRKLNGVRRFPRVMRVRVNKQYKQCGQHRSVGREQIKVAIFCSLNRNARRISHFGHLPRG